MNIVSKSLIGLAITGTTVAGATLASSSFFKENKKKQDEVIVDFDTSPAAWARRNADRVETLKKLFAEANEEKRRDLAEIINGSSSTVASVFDMDENSNFRDRDLVATEIDRWCGKRDDDPVKLGKHKDFKKDDICKL